MSTGSTSAGWVDNFLKIDGIQGGSTDSQHKNEIDVLSWGWGATNSGNAAFQGGSGGGKVAPQDFEFTMYTSKASPKLMEACAKGTHINQVVLTCRKAGGSPVEFLKITMKKVLVSSYQMGSNQTQSSTAASSSTTVGSNANQPIDTVMFNIGSIKQEFKEQNSDGSAGATTQAGYSFVENKAD